MRSTAESLELDSSLRQSRTIYVTLAIVLLPFAAAGFINIFSAVATMLQSFSATYFEGMGWSLFVFLIGACFVGVEYIVVAQCIEATRRLKTLRDDPEQKVRKMPAPFQSSLFGPYH